MLEVELIGNLGSDPELAYTLDGNPVCHFRVAANRGAGRQPTWVRVSAFGKLAENCAQYLVKGSKVFAAGRLDVGENGEVRVFTDKNGDARASLDLVARTVEFLSPRKGEVGGVGSAEMDVSEEEDIPY